MWFIGWTVLFNFSTVFAFKIDANMPIALSQAEEEAAMKAGASELKFLFDRENVPAEVQAKFYHVGVTTNAKLSAFASTAEELKEVLAKEFEIDAKKSLAERVMVANIQCAYQSAASRTTKLDEIAGELEARQMTKPLPMSEYSGMISNWEKKWWPLEEKDKPSRGYLEKKADELEQGELRAEALTAVLSYYEDDPDLIQTVWDASGTLKMKKGSAAVAEPMNPEQLRHRISLLGTGLMCLGMRNPNRAYLQGLTPQTFQAYLSYLLGDFVWQLTGKSSEGMTVAKPSWQQLLIYELEIRKKTWRTVYTSGATFAQALESTWKCPVTKERYFTTPVALAALSRPLVSNSSDAQYSQPNNVLKKNKAGKAGKGKAGKGNGKSRVTKSGCATRTPEGKTVCFGYNSSNTKCKNRSCHHQHVCGKCFGKHPMYGCTNTGAPAETQGN
jgi:hypothetical protein